MCPCRRVWSGTFTFFVLFCLFTLTTFLISSSYYLLCGSITLCARCLLACLSTKMQLYRLKLDHCGFFSCPVRIRWLLSISFPEHGFDAWHCFGRNRLNFSDSNYIVSEYGDWNWGCLQARIFMMLTKTQLISTAFPLLPTCLSSWYIFQKKRVENIPNWQTETAVNLDDLRYR